MAIRAEIRAPGQPQPISHYTDAVRAGDLVFVSGVVQVDTGATSLDPLALSLAPAPA